MTTRKTKKAAAAEDEDGRPWAAGEGGGTVAVAEDGGGGGRGRRRRRRPGKTTTMATRKTAIMAKRKDAWRHGRCLRYHRGGPTSRATHIAWRLISRPPALSLFQISKKKSIVNLLTLIIVPALSCCE